MADHNPTKIFEWKPVNAEVLSTGMTEEAVTGISLWSCKQDGFWFATVSDGKWLYTGQARSRDRAVAFALRELSNHILISAKPEYT